MSGMQSRLALLFCTFFLILIFWYLFFGGLDSVFDLAKQTLYHWSHNTLIVHFPPPFFFFGGIAV
jgi:hypothetical protein